EPRHRRARLLAGRGRDVEPLEVVAIAREALDLGLRGRTRQREGALGSLAGHLDDLADPTEARQVLRAEVEHAGPVPEGPGVLVDRDVVVGLLRRDGAQPLQALRLI